MNVLVIDQCSATKDSPGEVRKLTLGQVDRYRNDALNAEGIHTVPAKELYQGRQHPYVDSAVATLRQNGHTVDRYFISAGFGLVEESESLPPYEVTFSSMTDREIDARASTLGIPDAFVGLVSDPRYNLVLVPVGNDYTRSAQLEAAIPEVPETTTVVLFNQEPIADSHANVASISARNADAKRHGVGAVALKGYYVENLARNLGLSTATPSPAEIKRLCVETSGR